MPDGQRLVGPGTRRRRERCVSTRAIDARDPRGTDPRRRHLVEVTEGFTVRLREPSTSNGSGPDSHVDDQRRRYMPPELTIDDADGGARQGESPA